MPSPRTNRMYEIAFTNMINGLKLYAQAHQAEYDQPIGDDAVLGDSWENIARGILGLLDGETGKLDPGTIDGSIRRFAVRNGIDIR